MKRIKQVVSSVLAMIMILSLGATPVQAAGRGQQGWSSVTYGADESKAEETAEPAEEISAENEVEAPAEEPEAAAEEPAATADESEAPAEEPAATADETEVPAEEPAASAEPAVSYPAVTLAGATEGGVTVRVEAPEGTLPEGAFMMLKDVTVEEVQAKVSGEIAGKILTAVDITFLDNDGNEIQPGGNVAVSIKAPELAEAAAQNLDILHINEEKNEAEELTEEENAIEVKAAAADEVAFVNDAFSIYVVVDTGDDARLFVRFLGLNDAEIATIPVKKDDNMTQVLYDPGAGTLGEGVFFRGWTTEQNYTTATASKTIANVREDVTPLLNQGVTDGDTVTYYAMLFKSYTITYFEEHDISLGQDDVVFRADADANQPYTVNMAYTTSDNEHHFEGWNVRNGGSYIDGYTDGTIYQNGDEITLTGSIELGANAPEGHWLVFDENGKGGKYNAPEFIESSETTAKPCPDSEMTRFGYTFGGWYKDAACTDGNEFTFGSTISDYTVIYAKWISNTTANYTVIIWKQKTSGNDYDFYKSIHLSGPVNQTPTGVSTYGSGDGAYARIDGVNYVYTNNTGTIAADFKGFHFASTNQSSQAIATEGTTVVDVYYDRNIITINFNVANNSTNGYRYYAVTGNIDTSGNTTYYTDASSGRRELFHSSGLFGLGAGWVYFNGLLPTLYRGDIAVWPVNGTLYTREYVGNFDTETIQGRYGSTLAENGYTWPDDNDWYDNQTLNGTRTTFLDAFLPTSNDTTIDFYGARSAGSIPIRFYKQDADKQGYTLANTVYTSSGAFHLSDKYDGYKCVSWNTVDNLNSRHPVGNLMNQGGNYYYDADPNTTGYQYATFGNQGDTGLYVYFDRIEYPLSFQNGAYYKDLDREEVVAGVFKEEMHSYGEDLSAYNNTPYVPDPLPNYPGYVFAGWYLDELCTHPCTFTDMPHGGLTVYAKWMKIAYRVYLNPNYPSDATGMIDWGSSSQKMCFLVEYGGKISAPFGRLNGYDFVGWYRDPAYSQTFNDEAYVLNEVTVTEQYDQENEYTDTYDANGNLTNPTNEDQAQGRTWVTKKFQIYAKWRRNTEGASGIGVEYDANGGSNAPGDTNTYVDGALAPAGPASTAPQGQMFGYWEIQKWENNDWTGTGQMVLPGNTFHVLAENAKIEEIAAGSDPDHPQDTKKYTVQLKAVYVPSEQPTPTHISWFWNDGEAAFHTDILVNGNYALGINQGVNIQAPIARQGYTFKGWARLPISTSTDPVAAAAEATAWEADEDNWTQLNVSEFLYYNADDQKFYSDASFANEAKQVAADEDLPYHAMFAIWDKLPIYIFHSSDGTLEALKEFPDTIDFRNYVKGDKLYGGCFTAYGAYTVTEDDKAAALAKVGQTDKYYNTTAPDYDGSAFKSGLKRYWLPANKAAGKVQPGTVYYIKEVPNGYLDNATQFVYDVDTNKVSKLYFLTATDDTSYNSVFFRISSTGDKTATLCTSLTFQEKKTGNDPVVLTAGDAVFSSLPRGYLGYWDASSLLQEDETYTITPGWVTPDGKEVTGRTRTLSMGDCTNDPVNGIRPE